MIVKDPGKHCVSSKPLVEKKILVKLNIKKML